MSSRSGQQEWHGASPKTNSFTGTWEPSTALHESAAPAPTLLLTLKGGWRRPRLYRGQGGRPRGHCVFTYAGARQHPASMSASGGTPPPLRLCGAEGGKGSGRTQRWTASRARRPALPWQLCELGNQSERGPFDKLKM